VLLALSLAGCYEFHLVGPEDPPTISPPEIVSVEISYRQPDACEGRGRACEGNVVFYGSWMRNGAEFSLAADATNRVWRGTAYGVPVNYPPRDAPYSVHVYDPFLSQTSSRGMAGERITVGGEKLMEVAWEGTVHARALVLVDQNGQGHNPY
ncbi:MAG: hypothetical protein JXO72_05665, partial [Vicinamibacteria bacterium]|nr:hypothetical protein [Vicinamibacteria bacterium]